MREPNSVPAGGDHAAHGPTIPDDAVPNASVPNTVIPVPPDASPNGHRATLSGGVSSPLQERLLFGAALLILLLSANQQSYAPKQGIHTVVHVTPGDLLVWAVALILILPVLERCRAGRIFSWVVLAGLVGAGLVLSHEGHEFLSVVHHGLHSSHTKRAVEAALPLLLAVWQLVRLVRPGPDAPPRGLRLPALPREIVALLVVALLSAVTMVLPSEALGDLLKTPDGKDALRKAALFLIELFQHFAVALFLFLYVLRTPGRIRLALRIVALAVLVGAALALWQSLHHAAPLNVRGLMQSRRAWGGYCAITLPLLLACLIGSRRTVVKIGFAVVILLALSTLLSGAPFWCSLIGLMTAGLIAAGQRPRLESLHAPGAVAALGLIVAALVVAALQPRQRTPVFSEFVRLRNTPPAALREPGGPAHPIKKEYVEWIAGLYMTGEHFWLGVGPGQYQLNIGQYYGEDPNPAIRLEPDSNNLYFVYSASLGLAGLAAVLQVFLSALARSWRSTRLKPMDEAAIGNGAGVSAFWNLGEGRAIAAGVVGSLLALLLVNLFTNLLVRGTSIAVAFLLALSLIMDPARRAAVHHASAVHPETGSELEA